MRHSAANVVSQRERSKVRHQQQPIPVLFPIPVLRLRRSVKTRVYRALVARQHPRVSEGLHPWRIGEWDPRIASPSFIS